MEVRESLEVLDIQFESDKERFQDRYTKDQRKKILNDLIFTLLFFFNIAIACSPVPKLSQYISNVCGSTTVPFLQFVLPGALFYHFAMKCGELNEEQTIQHQSKGSIIYWMIRSVSGKKFAMFFVFIGMVQIFAFSAIIIFGFYQ